MTDSRKNVHSFRPPHRRCHPMDLSSDAMCINPPTHLHMRLSLGAFVVMMLWVPIPSWPVRHCSVLGVVAAVGAVSVSPIHMGHMYTTVYMAHIMWRYHS